MSNKSRTATIHNPRYQTFVNHLVRIRRAAGISQEKLGATLGLSQSDISKIERFDRRIDILETLDWLKYIKKENAITELTSLVESVYERSNR